MKQSLACTFIILSLILSLISFILSLIAFYLPNWKSIQLPSTFLPRTTSEDNQMDPLILSEVDKYNDILYHRGEIHSFGLLTHCIVGGNCGQNLLPSFHEANYKLCHNIKFHHQCIFSDTLSKKCTCQKPFYISLTYNLLICILCLQIVFIVVNLLRLYRRYYHMSYLNDIYLRLFAIISTLLSILFLCIILIQQNNNRLIEPLEFFELMRRYYSRIQIYAFSNDLEVIIKQLEQDLDIHFGASYICIIFILILTIISFLMSSTVEIKILPNIEEDEKKNEQNHVLLQPPPVKRFVPSDKVRFIRQTKV